MADPADTDEALMVRVQRGDRAAWEALHERWRQPLFSFLVKRTGARAEAEEAFQDTWMRVYRSRRRYDPRRPFRSWLFAIAVNAGRDARRPEAEIFQIAAEPGDPIGLRDLLVDALQALEPEDRRLLLLAVEGFTAAEIGEMLGLGPGAVRMRLSRARERVRAALGSDDA